MSGIFWEQDRQPNLCEAASGFTFSTINLLVAVPMALLDLLVTCLLAIWSLTLSLVLPVLEVTQSGLTALADFLGLTEMPPPADLVLPCLAAAVAVHIYLEHRQGATGHQLASKYCLVATGLLWLAALHAAPDFATSPRLVVVALALSVASYLPGLVVAMTANFRPAAVATTSLLEAAAGLSSLLAMEAGLVAVVAAYGYPDLLASGQAAAAGAEEGELTQYLCVIPACACLLVYATLRQPGVEAGASHAEGAATMNGSAVPVRDTTVASEPEAPAPEEPAHTAVEDVAPAAVENPPVEAVGSVEDDQAPAPETTTGDDTTAAVEEVTPEPEAIAAPEAAAETKAEEENKPAVSETDSAVAPETKGEEEEDVLVAKLRSRLGGLVGCVWGRLSALVGVAGAAASRGMGGLASLPWFWLSLTLATTASHLLAALAWNLLAANQLALLLPLFSLVTPLLLDRLGGKLPATWSTLAGQLSGLAVASLHYSLVASAPQEDQ